MTAIEDLKKELHGVQQAQADFVNEDGTIKHEYKYKYKSLVEVANHLHKSILWLEALQK